MKSLKWIGALPEVHLVINEAATEVSLGTVVEVDDEAAVSMLESGNWEEQAAEEPEGGGAVLRPGHILPGEKPELPLKPEDKPILPDLKPPDLSGIVKPK